MKGELIEGLCQCGCGQITPLWKKNDASQGRGRVRGQHMKVCPGHGNGRAPEPASKRFWSKVTGAEATECWEWQGYVMPNGYGQFGNEGKVLLAHRWAYEALRAEIPDGLDIDHLCINRRCVNPWHLEPVTRAVNLARQKRHQRNQATKEKS